MRAQLALGLALLLAATSAMPGSASGAFSVAIRLNAPTGGAVGDVCVSGTGVSTQGSSVQVRCSDDVFVDITQGRFMPSFQPSRDTLLPDFCRSEQAGVSHRLMHRAACRLDEDERQAGLPDEESDGWQIGDSLFAMDPEAQEQLAQVRSRDDRGTLTALLIANGSAGMVEMLVSF